MAKTRLSRETLLPKLAGHVLEHGLSDVSLRPLAKAAGTSDRMLLYHFGSKEQLVADLLGFLSQSYEAHLEAALPIDRASSRAACLRQVLAATQTPQMAPFLRLWWQIVAESARGNSDYRDSAQAIMRTLSGWLERQMPAGDPDPQGGALFLLTLIEGAQMLDAVGCGDIAAGGILAFGASAAAS